MEHEKGVTSKGWIHDRMLLLAIAIFAIGATGYIGASKIFMLGSSWLDPVKEFFLLVSMIGVVSLGYELFLRKMVIEDYKIAIREVINPDALRLGVIGLFKDRTELKAKYGFPQIFTYISEAEHEIFICGPTLLVFATAFEENFEILKNKILQGVNVKLLLMNPKSKILELIRTELNMPDEQGKPSKLGDGYVSDLKTSILKLKGLQEKINNEEGDSKKGKLLIHTYDKIPSHSSISLDPDKPGGMIIADIGPYLGRGTPRPTMVVVNKEGGLYKYWQGMNDEMWKGSKILTHDDGE